MKKTLNDSLREEFAQILRENDNLDYISIKKLDPKVIDGALEKLLTANVLADPEEEIERVRAVFETFIINELRRLKH